MNRRSFARLYGVLLAVIASVLSFPGMAAGDFGSAKVVDGMAMYLGVMPAEIIRGHAKSHPEARMHGGPPAWRHRDHVVLAVFDNTTGKRIEDAEVTAEVTGLGLAPQIKPLDPMAIADTVTYGNYFNMSGDGIYRIQVRVRRPGSPRAVEATFSYRHTGR